MYDPTDLLEQKGQILEFYQTFSGATVSFKAFLKNYSESFTCNWNQQRVFGRPDPIQTYQGTERSLKLSWKIPAVSLDDAVTNMAKTSTLTRMLYPEYSKVDNASTISKGPLIKIKFSNLIFDASRGPSGDVRTCGLLGVVTNMTWAPVIEEGFFDPLNKLYPKLLEVGIGFNVLHQHSLGWEKAEAIESSRLIDQRENAAQAGNAGAVVKAQKRLNSIQDFADAAAPNWGADASLFPWSAGAQKGSTAFIGNFDTGDVIQEVAISELLGGDD